MSSSTSAAAALPMAVTSSVTVRLNHGNYGCVLVDRMDYLTSDNLNPAKLTTYHYLLLRGV
jgi:hypothetical protein